MKILTNKQQIKIAKLLAAIYYTAVHGFGNSKEGNIDSMTKIVEHVADIAYLVGGEQMMDIGVPALVYQLQEYAKSKGDKTS